MTPPFYCIYLAAQPPPAYYTSYISAYLGISVIGLKRLSCAKFVKYLENLFSEYLEHNLHAVNS